MVLIASSTVQLVRRWSQALKGDFVTHGVEDGAALEQVMAQFKPPVLLLDLALLRSSRIQSIARLHRLSPATKIIVFTSTPNEQEGISVLKSGAKGYCQRNVKPALLKKVVKLVQRGEIWAGRKLIPPLIEELTSLIERQQKRSPTNVDDRFDALTYREREIVSLIAGGSRNKEIASQIHMSERTVKAHLTAIFRKVGVPNRTRLALVVSAHSPLEN
jgi:two-component system NarL family response regulator